MISIIGITSIIILIVLAFLLLAKMEKIKQMQSAVDNLKNSLDEMDEQAKLIVRTDMELNKTQEELDKKITGLYSLQRLSRAISTTLEEKQIFNMIDPSYMEDLGFEKACGFLWNTQIQGFQLYINIGYTQDESEEIKSSVNANKNMYLDLIKTQKTISSSSTSSDMSLKNKINRTYKTNSFIISPLVPKEGNKGFLFVGTEKIDTLVTEGDEELITILSNQLGQALDNARLFENTWQAHQELENRVEQRTHELTLALDEVRKISKRKTDFVSSVSHELRTPLTSIKGYASILLAEKLGALPSEVKLRLEKINRHSDELAQLVNDLLDISRIQSGRVIMKRESHNLKEIINGAVELLSEQLKERQIELSVDMPEEANVSVDAGQIKRVFINIIGNAIKFTPPKGKISISVRKAGKNIEVDTSDTGCGIPEEARESIFEEFYRVENAINEEVKGTGLGLALVKNIIEAHKGKIWVTSKIGAGSTFSFVLPQEN
ncbi:MAG: ATP-binding protein [Candidatus Omnitrophica bacterium]|nr:ATP-binding protein [Candidatus Omnitrophota bacterium]